MKINVYLLFSIYFLTLPIQGQIDNNKFNNKSDYLNYVAEKYSLESSSIYYINNQTKDNFISFLPSFVYFINKGRVVSFDEVTKNLDPNCSIKKSFRQISYEFINDLLNQKKPKINIVFKNLSTDTILKPEEEITAVFLFSVHLERLGIKYIKHREYLKKLGMETIIISMDMPDIPGMTDYSKINQINIKKSYK